MKNNEFDLKGTQIEKKPHGSLENIQLDNWYMFYSKRPVGVAIIVFTVLTGAIYLTLQMLIAGKIVDGPFVGLLTGATLYLYLAIKNYIEFFKQRNIELYVDINANEEPMKLYNASTTKIRKFLSFIPLTTAGIFYGGVIGGSVFILNLWQVDIKLKWSLASFLFIVNFMTGIAFYTMIYIYYVKITTSRFIHVELWNSETTSNRFILDSTKKMTLLSSLYISVCISSILFSVFPFSSIVIIYTLFSACIIITALILPTIHTTRQLSNKKVIAIQNIDCQIQKEYQKILNQIIEQDAERKHEKLDSLFSLKDKILSVNTFPFKINYIITAFGVLTISLMPVLIQTVANTIIKIILKK